jgi:glycerophosphoryl diester phosphodiesterase
VWFAPRFAGTRIPTLAEALDAIQPGAMTLVEHKTGDAATCVALLAGKNVLERVVVQSFDWRFIADCRRLAPTLILGALGKQEMTPAKLTEMQRAGANLVGWCDRDITPQAIAAAHACGLKAWVFTVDEPQRARQLIADGIDGIISNVPGTIMATIHQRVGP